MARIRSDGTKKRPRDSPFKPLGVMNEARIDAFSVLPNIEFRKQFIDDFDRHCSNYLLGILVANLMSRDHQT